MVNTMTLDFQINQDYLVAHTLVSTDGGHFSSEEHKQDIVAFQDYAWEVSGDLYNSIPERTNVEMLLKLGSFSEYAKRVGQLDDYFAKLKQSKKFKIIFEQAEKYRQFCESEWNKNYEKISKIISDLT